MTQRKSTKVACICARCGSSFLRAPSQVGNGYGTYCSRACKHAPRPLIPHPTIPNCMIVLLTKGKVALIDADDAELIGQHTWSVMWSGRRWYARRMDAETRKHIYMHRAILDTPEGIDGDHRDGDGLNN